MPHEKVTLVWGYQENKPPEFRQLVKDLQARIQPITSAYKYSDRPVDDIHITVLGCEAKERSGEFYSRPLLQHLFGSRDIATIQSGQLAGKQIDFNKLASILHVAFDTPITVQFGGYKESSWPPLLYPGWSLYRMSFYFGFLASNFVVVGWPTPFWGWQLMGVRTLVEKANVMHKYHYKGEWPPDGDAYAVLGEIADFRVHPHPRHHSEVECFPPDITSILVDTRDWLSNLDPVIVEFTKDNVEFVAYTDPKLARPRKRLPLSEVKNGGDIRNLY